MDIGGPLCVRKQLAGRSGEVDGMRPPVGRVTAAFDEASLFEVIDEADHRVAVDGKAVGKLLLGLTVRGSQMHEQAEVAGLQAQRRKALSEPLRGVGTDLGDQEPGTAGKRGAGCRPVAHRTILNGDCNHPRQSSTGRMTDAERTKRGTDPHRGLLRSASATGTRPSALRPPGDRSRRIAPGFC